MSYFSGTTGERIQQLLDAIDFNDAQFRQGGIQPDGTRNTSLDTGDSINIPNVDGSTGTTMASTRARYSASSFAIAPAGASISRPRSLACWNC